MEKQARDNPVAYCPRCENIELKFCVRTIEAKAVLVAECCGSGLAELFLDYGLVLEPAQIASIADRMCLNCGTDGMLNEEGFCEPCEIALDNPSYSVSLVCNKKYCTKKPTKTSTLLGEVSHWCEAHVPKTESQEVLK